MKRLSLFMLVFMLTACGAGEEEIILPTDTPEPLAFFAATPISPGRPQNPLRLVFVPPDAEDAATAAPTLQSELSSRSGLAIEVVLAESYGEALSLLCDYNDDDRYAAPWLSGPAAVMAVARECGDVALQGTSGGRTGLAGEIVSTSGAGLGAVQGRTFCRLDASDFYSWVLPTLEMQSRNINPTEIADVDDYPSYELMFGAIQDGLCIATGVPAGLLDTDEYEDFDQLVVATTTIPMPYGILVYPPELLLADREALTEAFLEVAAPAAAATEEVADTGTPSAELVEVNEVALTTPQRALLDLLGAESVAPVTVDDLAEVQAFMETTGLDLVELGRQ